MSKTSFSRHCLSILGWAVVYLGVPAVSFAHPMGNFSINHYAKITVYTNFVEVHYLIDSAEIPTFQEMQQGGFTADPQGAATQKYLSREAEAFMANLRLTISGSVARFKTKSMDVIFPPGAGGLPTMKMSFVYVTPLVRRGLDGGNSQASSIYYRDNNFPSRIGWKEVVAVPGAGVKFVNASAPSNDRSGELSNYPTDLLNSPPNDVEANINFELLPAATAENLRTEVDAQAKPRTVTSHAKSATASKLAEPRLPAESIASANMHLAAIPPATVSRLYGLRVNQQGTPKNRFTELMTAKPFSLWFLFMAAGIAAGLGALHALEPGHGKTIVAAYLVGSRGTARHAVLLGIVVTAAHTAGVYLLGLITLYASAYIVPEQLYPWLGAISGVTVAGLILIRGRA